MRRLIALAFACSAPQPLAAIERIEPQSATNLAVVAVRIEGSFPLPVTSNLDTGELAVEQIAASIASTPLDAVAWRGHPVIEAAVPIGLPVGTHDVVVTLGDETARLENGYTVIDSCADYVALGSSRYKAGPHSTWYDAQADCERDGAHLVVIDDAAESALVEMFVPPQPDELWIGLTDHAVEGSWTTIFGMPLPFMSSNWGVTQPNDFDGREDCGEMFSATTWGDAPCSKLSPYLCECSGVRSPQPPVYCNTDRETDCGQCGSTCTQICGVDQVCDGDAL